LALLFPTVPGSLKSSQTVEFLKALHATIGRKLLIIWDRLQAHRSRLVREYVEQQRGSIALEFLPPYAPELNPVECVWGYLKSHGASSRARFPIWSRTHMAQMSFSFRGAFCPTRFSLVPGCVPHCGGSANCPFRPLGDPGQHRHKCKTAVFYIRHFYR
jgi:hypothetical protein